MRGEPLTDGNFTGKGFLWTLTRKKKCCSCPRTMKIKWKTKSLRNVAWAVGIALAAALVAFAASKTGLINAWELKTYDARMWFAVKSRPTPTHVVMFYVDERGLRQMDAQGVSWPWPRELYSEALEFCRVGGARAILFDLFFSEDSVYGVDDDTSFAAGVVKGPPSYFVTFLTKDEPKEKKEADPRMKAVVEKGNIHLEGAPPDVVMEGKSLSSLPVWPLVDAAFGFGNAQLPPDDDGIYRRLPLVARMGEKIIPSIPLKIAADLSSSGALSWSTPRMFHFGQKKIPQDANGQMMLNYYGGVETFPAYSLSDIFLSNAALAGGKKPTIDPTVVKNKIVIIGVAAPGLYDPKSTPLSRIFPGPEIHATAIENILTSDFMRPASAATNIAFILLCALLAALWLARSGSGLSALLFIALFSAIFTATTYLLFRMGIWVEVVPPLMALGLSSFSTIFRNYMTEGRKKREIRKAFGQYLSPHVVGKIAENPEALKLGGAEQEVTLFFSDIVGFTSISEKITPTELVSQLNSYFSETTRIIQEAEGTLDKYIGDAIMAFWGAPLVIADHASRAVMAAMAIQKALTQGALFETRIGLHTGPAVVGNIGSDIRFNYTAIGDAVNLASRLEGLNKQFGTHIIMSETTWKASLDLIEARRVGRVRVKGREEPVGIYEPLGTRGERPKFTEG